MRKRLFYMLFPILLYAGAALYQDAVTVELPEFCVVGEGREERISCWSEDGSAYYVFLPSYADLDQVRIRTDTEISLDGIELPDGAACADYTCNVPYELRIGKKDPAVYSLQFLQSENVAAMYIRTKSGSMEEIHAEKSHREGVTVTLYTSDGILDYASRGADSINGRGNVTWWYRKKPYILRLSEENDLLGMGAAKKWTLLTNIIDKTNLRNKIVLELAQDFTEYWTPECEYVDLYLNGEYTGLYLLTEKVEAAPGRLEIGEDAYLLGLDLTSRAEETEPWITLDDGISVEIQAPSELSGQQMEQVEDRLREMGTAILAEDGIHPDTGKSWKDYIDVDSWAWKYLIDEVFENYDAGACSQYYYWSPDAEDDRIYAGPPWDYDNILGASTQKNPRCFLAQRTWKAPDVRTPWYGALCEKEEFYERVVELYRTRFLPRLQRLTDSGIREAALQIGRASEMNRIRWRSYYEGRSVSDWTEEMRCFLEERMEFLNRAWIDQVEYQTVCLEIPKDYRYFEVETGHTIEDLPTPAELEISDSELWYDKATGEVFDSSRPITEELVLYDKEGREDT